MKSNQTTGPSVDSQRQDLGQLGLLNPEAAQKAIQAQAATIAELVEACKGLLGEMWCDRKRNVKKHYHLMVAEVAAQNAIAKVEGHQ